MYTLMFRQFFRTGTCTIGLVLLLLLGSASIMIGKQFLDQQEKSASQVVQKQSEHTARNIDFHGDDIGLLLYYLKFSLVNRPSPLSGLSIGQRDLNPSVQHITIRTLEAQKHDTDLVNPVGLLYGNLDFSFVLIYILPLLIIAFTYNLRSEEEEVGTWRLVSIMSPSKFGFLWGKMSVRAISILVVVSVLFIIAIVVLNIPFGFSLLAFSLTTLLYLLFWFALCFWVISLARNSSFNALLLLTLWLVMVVLLPAALNNRINTKYPVPEALTTMIAQRDGYHEKWDMNKRETVAKFYQHYPHLESFDYPPEEGFNWLWYYAMQFLGDDESKEESALMQTKVSKRESISKKWGRFIPSIHAQLAFNDIAQTGLANHMEFLNATDEFHERTRLYFYPKIFSEANAQDVDWEQFEAEFFQQPERVKWAHLVSPLLIAILFVIGLIFINRNKD